MTQRDITFIPVGNSNFCFISIDGMSIVLDLGCTKDKSSFSLLKALLKPDKNGVRYLDVLCVSHGDTDHCRGFAEFKKAMDDGTLIIGSIWHPDYDRSEVQDTEDLTDYCALHEEIERRKKVKQPGYGDIQVALTAWDDESIAFQGLTIPDNVSLKVLNPYLKDDEEDMNVNESSLVINLCISELSILYMGDAGYEAWQERIIPHTLTPQAKREWAQADILVNAHHGSFSFFGKTRDEVREADPYPDNYEALDYISPAFMITSASTYFPTSRDQSGDQPPHYAAWKWYHKWFCDNRNIDETDKHPACWKYTADGYIRLEYGDDGWEWLDDWSPDDDGDDGGSEVQSFSYMNSAAHQPKGFSYMGGPTKRGGRHYA